MRCKNCKRSFGLDLELGIENENIGSCSICLSDVCVSCANIPGIDTQVIVTQVVICNQCIRRLGEASKAAAA